jgi:hypothetical protein
MARSAVPRRVPGDELRRFVETFAEEHPPLSLDAADLTMKHPDEVSPDQTARALRVDRVTPGERQQADWGNRLPTARE